MDRIQIIGTTSPLMDLPERSSLAKADSPLGVWLSSYNGPQYAAATLEIGETYKGIEESIRVLTIPRAKLS